MCARKVFVLIVVGVNLNAGAMRQQMRVCVKFDVFAFAEYRGLVGLLFAAYYVGSSESRKSVRYALRRKRAFCRCKRCVLRALAHCEQACNVKCLHCSYVPEMLLRCKS